MQAALILDIAQNNFVALRVRAPGKPTGRRAAEESGEFASVHWLVTSP